jgi:hypothetical protein
MTVKLCLDLLVLLLVLASTGIVLLGWGNLIWRWLGIQQPSQPSVLTVWLGFCVVVASLEVVHLFVPIDWKVTLAVALIGALGQRLRAKFARSKESSPPTAVEPAVGVRSLVVNAIKTYPLISIAGLSVIVSWCLIAMQTPSMFDSGLYHFGSIRWLNEYAIVPGLGNLHWRLALNQSYFGFLAMLNISPYWGHGYAAGGLFLLILTAFTVLEVALKQSMLWRWIFGGLFFSYLCLLSGQIANPMPDTAMALLQVVIFVFLYGSLVTQTTTQAQIEPAANVSVQHLQIVLVFLCLTIVTIKLSSVGFAAASFAIVSVALFRSSGRQLPYSLLLKLGSLVGLFTLVHIGRSYLLSGTPFFPSPIGGIWSLTWAVPFGIANNESQLIYAWAKQPGISLVGDVPAGFGWVGAWVRALPQTLKYLFVVSTLLVLLALILRQRSMASASNKSWLLGISLIAALIFWFFTAPDPRFLGATVVLYFAWSLYIFSGLLKNLVQRYAGSVFKASRTVINLLVIIGMVALFARWSLSGISGLQGWGSLPNPNRELKVNPLSYKAFVPTTDTLCWDSELPCTFMLDDGLQRKPLSELAQWLLLQPQRFSLSIAR